MKFIIPILVLLLLVGCEERHHIESGSAMNAPAKIPSDMEFIELIKANAQATSDVTSVLTNMLAIIRQQDAEIALLKKTKQAAEMEIGASLTNITIIEVESVEYANPTNMMPAYSGFGDHKRLATFWRVPNNDVTNGSRMTFLLNP